MKPGRNAIIRLYSFLFLMSAYTGKPLPALSKEVTVIEAVRKGNIEKLKDILITENVNEKNKNNESALHYACKESNLEIVKLLIDKAAEINAQDSKGNTPMHWAASANNKAAIEVLLSRGADWSTKNLKNKTPENISKEKGKMEICKILASVRIENSWQRAQEKNTIVEYRRFMEMNEDAVAYLALARKKIEDIAWTGAQQKNNYESYRQFAMDFPKSAFANEANDKAEELRWNTLIQDDKVHSIQLYLESIEKGESKGKYKAKALEKIDVLLNSRTTLTNDEMISLLDSLVRPIPLQQLYDDCLLHLDDNKLANTSQTFSETRIPTTDRPEFRVEIMIGGGFAFIKRKYKTMIDGSLQILRAVATYKNGIIVTKEGAVEKVILEMYFPLKNPGENKIKFSTIKLKREGMEKTKTYFFIHGKWFTDD